MAAADSYFMNRLPKKLTDLDLGASGLVDRLRRASTTTKVAACVSVAGGVLLLRRRRKGKPPAPQPTSYYCHEPPVKSFVTGADSALMRGMSSGAHGRMVALELPQRVPEATDPPHTEDEDQRCQRGGATAGSEYASTVRGLFEGCPCNRGTRAFGVEH